jgi:hypothetical protein
MPIRTCYVIRVPSGGLVPNKCQNLCVTSALGVSLTSVNVGTERRLLNVGASRIGESPTANLAW